MFKKKRKTRVSFKKNFFFLATSVQQQIDIFLPDPKRRLTQENQEKECQETLQNSKTWKRQLIRTTQ